MKYCLNCGKTLNKKWQKRFCSSSCAAKMNNAGRIRSLDSKRKTSSSLLGKGCWRKKKKFIN